jgi:hypothetical protein
MRCRRHARLPVQPPLPSYRRDHAAPDRTRTPQGHPVLSAGHARILETSECGHPDSFIVEFARSRERASAVYAQRTRDTQVCCRRATNALHGHAGRGRTLYVRYSCPVSHSRTRLLHPTPGHLHTSEASASPSPTMTRCYCLVLLRLLPLIIICVARACS